jgi:DNA primase small subunit
MSAAIRVLDTTLRHDFGFKHIMWVFSGRRGVHCWVCDPRSRRLSHDQRASIVDFLSLYVGKEKKINLGVTAAGGALHPTLQRAYEQLLPYFEDMIDSQGWFDNKDKIDQILSDYIQDGPSHAHHATAGTCPPAMSMHWLMCFLCFIFCALGSLRESARRVERGRR